MESRFGRDFGGVRVHTGPLAAAAAAELNARAFALGRHVIFGEGQYHEETPQGLRLLAHELAHVAQQERGREARPGLPLSVGAADDPLEREAELGAERILTPAPLPPLTGDASGSIRRAVRVNAASAGIDPVTGQAKTTVTPNLGVGNSVAVCNLTNGFDPDPNKVLWAFNFLGHVKVSLGPVDSLAGWQFGFVQFMRHTFMGVFYAGRVKREGSVSVLIHPAIAPKPTFMLDVSPNTTRPFMWPPSNAITQGEVDYTMGDHPVFAIDQRQHNFTTGVDNFLFHIVDVRDAYSIFTARDNSGRFQFLAHVHWDFRYDFKFQWRGGTASVAQDGSKIDLPTTQSVTLGAPTDPDVVPLLNTLSPSMTPIVGDQARAALKASLVQPNPNRSDNPEWFRNVPADFFK
jgi:hypothetical protein